MWYLIRAEVKEKIEEMESWLSGRKRLTANEVSPLKGFAGSNPALSAK